MSHEDSLPRASRDSSLAESDCCSSRGSNFGFQAPYIVIHSCLELPCQNNILMSSSGLSRLSIHVANTQIIINIKRTYPFHWFQMMSSWQCRINNRKVDHRKVQESITLNFNLTVEFPQDSVKDYANCWSALIVSLDDEIQLVLSSRLKDLNAVAWLFQQSNG